MPALPIASPVSLDFDQRSRLQSLLAHRLHQLTDPFENSEPWFRFDAVLDRWENTPRGWHTVEFPSLLDQLRNSTKQRHGSAAGGYESRPTGHLEAVDAEKRIDVEAADFVGAVLHRRPTSTDANLRLIAERVATLTDDELVGRFEPVSGKRVGGLERLVRSWWVSARILSGLESRPLTPHAHCPLCDAVDSLKVRLDVAERTGLAWCKSCKEAWDESNLGLLAAAITADPEPASGDADDVDTPDA